MRKITSALLTAAAVLLTTLAGEAGATYGGAPLDEGDPMLRSVVKLEITDKGWRSYCTGVIVAPDEIATASHCLFKDDNLPDPLPPESMSIRYYHDTAVGRVSRIRFNKINDLALLTIETKHPAGFIVPEMDLRPVDEIVQNSQGASFIHFGHGPQSRSAAAKLTRLDDKPLQLRSPDGVRLRMLHPNFPEARGTCGGDSGGPVMIRDGDGPLKLVGIHQAGHKGSINYAIVGSDGNCSRVSYFSPMARLKSWEMDMEEEARTGPSPERTVSPEIILMGKDAKPLPPRPRGTE